MNELHLDFDEVRKFNQVKLEFFYKEARRQRVDKAFCLFDLMRTLLLKESDSRPVFKNLELALNPHTTIKEIKKRDVEDGWASLRARRK